MKIVKSKFSKKASSQYGNFDFKPDPGFELRSYIDYQSKLIVVEESPITKKSGVGYLPKQYIVNPSNAEILKFEEYKDYFDYSEKEIISVDKKLKLIYQRKHDEETNRDYKEEKLIEMESGKILSTGKGIVFHKEPLKNALERYQNNIERRNKEKEKIDAQFTLDEHYNHCISNLKEGKFIIGYFDKKNAYKLNYINSKYVMSVANLAKGIAIENLKFEPYNSFNELEEFWNQFVSNPKWYLDYSPFKENIGRKEDRLITKLLVNEGNKIRKLGNFTKDEYGNLNTWENHVYTESIKRSEYKQYCSNCGDPRSFSARYPKCICRKCYSLITDKKGRKLEFFNTVAMGHGCQGYYTGSEPKEKYDTNICYINNIEYYAQEARFGGIVYQQKDKSL